MQETSVEGASPESAPPSRRSLVLAWTAVVCWAAVIWVLGGEGFSMSETSRHMLPWLDWLTGDLDWRTRYKILAAIRKLAHLVEYAILAVLTFRAALRTARKNRLATAGWVAAFLVAALATADEARQALTATRTGSPYDVLIDMTGGAIAIAAVIVIMRRMRSPDVAEPAA